MCLHLTENKKEQIAENDIICYKACLLKKSKWHLIKNFFGKNIQLTTPFQGCYVKLCETYESKLEIDLNHVHDGLHSFKENPGLDLDFGYHVIVECIIPKGSKYFEGITFGDLIGYASDKIKYVKIIENAKK